MVQLCFVSARRGNHFMTELLWGVADEVASRGIRVVRAFDEYPKFDDPTIYVVIPHELFVLMPLDQLPDSGQLQRTISFCVEMPGTEWFDLTLSYARLTGGAVSINRSATDELKRRGVETEHFR